MRKRKNMFGGLVAARRSRGVVGVVACALLTSIGGAGDQVIPDTPRRCVSGSSNYLHTCPTAHEGTWGPLGACVHWCEFGATVKTCGIAQDGICAVIAPPEKERQHCGKRFANGTIGAGGGCVDGEVVGVCTRSWCN